MATDASPQQREASPKRFEASPERLDFSPKRMCFPTRLMALPAVSDAVDYATHLYIKSKEYRVVGVALDAAESTLKSAVTVTAPLTMPLLDYVEHLKPLDDWACRRLDDVEMMIPSITKPTEEMLNDARQGVLVTLAGVDEPPPTLIAALSTRASRMATAARKLTAAATITVPHYLLDTAHSLLDRYLPEERSREKPVEPKDGMVVKCVALATKTSSRLCHSIHDRYHASCPLDPTPSHLVMECMQMIRLRCPKSLARVGQQKQQSVVFVVVFVLPLRMTLATVRILLVALTIFAEELNATRMKIHWRRQDAVEQKNGQQVHE